ncbi:MAG: hypothetical protein ACHQWU_12230 [Gemmatimonadales bacterium]
MSKAPSKVAYGVREAARLAGVPYSTLRTWIARGDLALIDGAVPAPAMPAVQRMARELEQRVVRVGRPRKDQHAIELDELHLDLDAAAARVRSARGPITRALAAEFVALIGVSLDMTGRSPWAIALEIAAASLRGTPSKKKETP